MHKFHMEYHNTRVFGSNVDWSQAHKHRPNGAYCLPWVQRSKEKHLAVVDLKCNSYDILCSDDKTSDSPALRG